VIHFYATDLNTYCHAQSPLITKEKIEIIIEPKKVLEFVQFLQNGDIHLDITETTIQISQGTAKGVFPIIIAEEFPLPPKLQDEEEEDITPSFLLKNLPFLLFTASTDDARPVLTGINFVVSDEELTLVATDGFRLSLVKEKRKGTFSSMIVPAEFLKEVLRHVKETQKVTFTYSDTEQIVRFTIGDISFYSRLITGDFPPFERVIPEEKKHNFSQT
jgi:DNA polymerase-3 subunit beta